MRECNIDWSLFLCHWTSFCFILSQWLQCWDLLWSWRSRSKTFLLALERQQNFVLTSTVGMQICYLCFDYKAQWLWISGWTHRVFTLFWLDSRFLLFAMLCFLTDTFKSHIFDPNMAQSLLQCVQKDLWLPLLLFCLFPSDILLQRACNRCKTLFQGVDLRFVRPSIPLATHSPFECYPSPLPSAASVAAMRLSAAADAADLITDSFICRLAAQRDLGIDQMPADWWLLNRLSFYAGRHSLGDRGREEERATSVGECWVQLQLRS